jgi:hypothetical protein
MVVLALQRLGSRYVLRSDRPFKLGDRPPSTVSIFDFRESWRSELQPLDTFNIFVPATALDELTESVSAPRIQVLSTGAGLLLVSLTPS